MIPQHTESYLLSGEVPYEGILTIDTGCKGAKFHSPQPLVVRAYAVCTDGLLPGTPQMSHLTMLCGTCADNLTIYLNLLNHANGKLAWEVRREFGNRIRQLAELAWPQETE